MRNDLPIIGLVGCFLCPQEFGCSLMVLVEFLVVQAGFGCSRMFLNVLISFWCSSLVFGVTDYF